MHDFSFIDIRQYRVYDVVSLISKCLGLDFLVGSSQSLAYQVIGKGNVYKV